MAFLSPRGKNSRQSSGTEHVTKQQQERKKSNEPHSEARGSESKKSKPTKIDKKELALRIKNATSTSALDLSGLQMSEIPSLPHTSWSVLDLGFNSFAEWPLTPDFVTLVELNMPACGLFYLADDLHYLMNLRKLALNGNHLTFIQDSISHLTCLQSLNLANNKITTITSYVKNLTSLEELFLGGNPLEAIPSEFSELKFLQQLDLNGCGLTALPPEFPGMVRLMELDLGFNKLTELPSEFGNMSRLVTLNLCDNLLTDLPISLGNCAMLTSCLLERNPITDEQLITKYNIGCDHLVEYLGRKWFNLQQQKKKQESMEKKKEKQNQQQSQQAKLASNTPRNSPRPPTFREDMNELKEREARFRVNSEHLATQCREELTKIKKSLVGATTVEELMPIAQGMRELIPQMVEARKLIPPVAALQQPQFRGDEDKVTKLKKTIIPRVREFEGILDGVTVVLTANPTMETLLELSGVISQSHAVLNSITNKF